MDVQARTEASLTTLSENSDCMIEISSSLTNVPEIAEKIFTEFAINCGNTSLLFKKKISDLHATQSKLNNSWVTFLYRNKTVILVGSIALGILLSLSASMFMYSDRYVQGTTLLICGLSVGILPPSFVNIYGASNYEEMGDNDRLIKTFKHSDDFLQILIPLTHHVSLFCNYWDDFKEDPYIENVKPLFEELKKVQENYALLSQKAVNLSNYKRYKKLWEKLNQSEGLDYPVFGSVSYLFLMEGVCKLLKKGPIVNAWIVLKISPSQKIIWGHHKVEPWTCLDMENPAQANDYTVFFKGNLQQADRSYADNLQHCFKEALTYYGSLKEV